MRFIRHPHWRFVATAMISLSLFVVTGCGQYWRNRAADAGDIFSLTGGVGLGVTAQAGPAATGFGVMNDCIGMRNGSPILIAPSFPSKGGGPVHQDQVTSASGALIFLYVNEIRVPKYPKVARWYHQRQKNSEHLQAFIFPIHDVVCDTNDWTFYTNFELGVGLGLSARAGFNPGELLDFLVGWFGVDLANDDRSAPPVVQPAPSSVTPPKS